MRGFKKKLVELIDKYELKHVKNKILSVAQYSILAKRMNVETYRKVGNSRFCGFPDLPPKIKWPKILDAKDEFDQGNIGEPKLFALQINLEELPDIGKLPRVGMLYFFIGCNCISGYGKVDSEVIYYPKRLNKIQYLPDKIKKTYDMSESSSYFLYNSYKMKFEKALTIPDSNSDFFETLNLSKEDEDKYYDLYEEYREFICEAYNERDLLNMMFGFVFCGGENLRKISAKENKKEKNWEVLFSLQSDSTIGLNFNDFGSFSFIVSQKDLKSMSFNNLETIIWSS